MKTSFSKLAQKQGLVGTRMESTHELLNTIKRPSLHPISIIKWKEIKARGTESLFNELQWETRLVLGMTQTSRSRRPIELQIDMTGKDPHPDRESNYQKYSTENSKCRERKIMPTHLKATPLR